MTTAKRILLVDDEEHLLVTLKDFLTFEGYAVHMARSGEEALMHMPEVKPDLVILDISMPGIGGLGFLSRMRAAGRSVCPVLVLTARSNLKDFFGEAGVAGFMAKPCRKEDLLRQIHTILAHHAPPEHQPGQKPARPRIVLGEDDARVGGVLEESLRKAGYDVQTAVSGPEVLEKVSVRKPDVVVVKGVLTRMNGEAVSALLKAMPGTAAIPIVLYDETRASEGTSARRWTPPSTVDRFVASTASFDLVSAVEDVLREVRAKASN